MADLKNSRTLILVNFNSLPTADIKNLRVILRNCGAALKMFKKRLLNIVLNEAQVALDSTVLEGQVMTVWAPSDVYGVAGKIQSFIKDLRRKKKAMNVAAAYDLQERRVINADEFAVIAALPPREILLARVAIVLTMPIKRLMLVLQGREKAISERHINE